MELSPHVCYRAVVSHDRRFDGLFFTCVKSTGIYCRPICPANVPKEENCTFVLGPAEAEKAGYRPCLRCRPEHAPATPQEERMSPARQLATYIDKTLLADETLTMAMHRFTLSDRHLRRLFEEAFGVEPKRYLTTRRLLFAKQLLQDTDLPVVQIAYAAGFQSRGRLTINMREAYGFTPERLRKESSNESVSNMVTLRADYRPPFNWIALLQFLKGRATSYERIVDGVYYRVIDGHEISVTNVPERNYLHIQIPAELSSRAYMILNKVRTLFDLDANPLVIAAELVHDSLLSDLICKNPGLRVPGCWDDFEMLVRVIVGQQVSVAGATTIMQRIVDRIGVTPVAIAASTPEVIAAIGMPLKRATTIWNISGMVKSGELKLDEPDPEVFYDKLVAIPGIGPWTAEYLRMRVLHWPDAFPAGDLGLQKAVLPGSRQTERQLMIRATLWRPWRSYATILLWKSLENQGG